LSTSPRFLSRLAVAESRSGTVGFVAAWRFPSIDTQTIVKRHGTACYIALVADGVDLAVEFSDARITEIVLNAAVLVGFVLLER
jgi:hypothetical protein